MQGLWASKPTSSARCALLLWGDRPITDSCVLPPQTTALCPVARATSHRHALFRGLCRHRLPDHRFCQASCHATCWSSRRRRRLRRRQVAIAPACLMMPMTISSDRVAGLNAHSQHAGVCQGSLQSCLKGLHSVAAVVITIAMVYDALDDFALAYRFSDGTDGRVPWQQLPRKLTVGDPVYKQPF